VVQCVLGVALAMYVSLPSSQTALSVFTSVPLLTAHIVIAFLLVAVAAYATALAGRLRLAGTTWLEALTLLFLLFALQEGFAYTFNQINAYDLGMVAGFLGALVVQIVVMSRVVRAARTARPPSAESSRA
jgi:thiosulfate reductase cytochrome b subunit